MWIAKCLVSISAVLILWTAVAFPQERQLKGLMREKLNHTQQLDRKSTRLNSSH